MELTGYRAIQSRVQCSGKGAGTLEMPSLEANSSTSSCHLGNEGEHLTERDT